eukprot:g6716.t1
MSVIRGPNLPPSVTGRLEGHFHLCIKDLKLASSLNLNSGRVAFWGLSPYDYPCFGLCSENPDISVVCPVTTEFELFTDYLAEYRKLKIEFLRRTAVVTSIFVDVQKTPPESEATPIEFKIAGRARGTVIGSCKVSYWFTRQRGIPNSSLLYLKTLRMQHNQNKRRLVARRQDPPTIETVDQIFDALEKIMARNGSRVIDLYRACDKFKTPVVDLSSLLDQFVEASIPPIVRQHFWLLLNTSAGTLFTSAKFSQHFKIAKQAVICVRKQVENGVRILRDLNQKIKASVLDKGKQRLNSEKLTTESLTKFIEESFPNASQIEVQTVLAFVFIWIPDRLYWTLNEIGNALDRGLQLGSKHIDSQLTVLEETKEQKQNLDRNTTAGEGDGQEADSTVEIKLEDSARKLNPVRKVIDPVPEGQSLSSGGLSLTKSDIFQQILNSIVPQNYPQFNSGPLSENLKSEKLEDGLNSLIVKCEKVLKGMASTKGNLARCSQSIVPKSATKHEIVVGSCLDNSLIGTSDDPDILIEDVYFSTLLEKNNSTPNRLYPKIKDSSKLCPGKLMCPTRSISWLKLVFHGLQLDPVVDPFVIIRSINFKTELVVSKEDIVWIPHSCPDSQVIIILEFHSLQSTKKTNTTPLLSKNSSEVLGYTRIKLEVNSGNPLINSERFSIKELFGSAGERGNVVLSLFQCKKVETSNSESLKEAVQTLGTVTKPESHPNLVEAQTQTDSAKQDVSKGTSSTQVQTEKFDETVKTCPEKPSSEIDDVGQLIIRVFVSSVKLMSPVQECSVSCHLEANPELIKTTQFCTPSSEDPELIIFNCTHDIPVHEKFQDCFDQSLIFKVLDIHQRLIGELHLDLASLPMFRRICGPMTMFDQDLNRSGVLQINVELLSNQDDQSLVDLNTPEQDPVLEMSHKRRLPFLTCSDDEDYEVVGDLVEDRIDPDLIEIDDLCTMLTENLDIHKPVQNQESISAELDVFQCEDDFMLDFTKQGIETTSREALLETESVEAKGKISISRTSSDQLGQGSKWKFKTSLPQVEEYEEQKKEEETGSNSVDIDALLEKYSIKRTPGWWKSLITETETEPTENKDEEQTSDQASFGSF